MANPLLEATAGAPSDGAALVALLAGADDDILSNTDGVQGDDGTLSSSDSIWAIADSDVALPVEVGSVEPESTIVGEDAAITEPGLDPVAQMPESGDQPAGLARIWDGAGLLEGDAGADPADGLVKDGQLIVIDDGNVMGDAVVIGEEPPAGDADAIPIDEVHYPIDPLELGEPFVGDEIIVIDDGMVFDDVLVIGDEGVAVGDPPADGGGLAAICELYYPIDPLVGDEMIVIDDGMVFDDFGIYVDESGVAGDPPADGGEPILTEEVPEAVDPADPSWIFTTYPIDAII